MKSKLALVFSASMVAAAANAADFSYFPPTNLPYGYIAPVGVSDYNLSDGQAKVYRPWFHNSAFYGDLKAYRINSSGEVGATVLWSAKDRLETLTNGAGWQTRKLFTNSGSSSITYGCESNPSDPLIKFICGDASVEDGTSIRNREAILGDIVHSQPVSVSHPQEAYTFGDYLSFADKWKDRAERIYVGANDGILHAFDASTGDELWGYIPSVLSAKLSNLDDPGYSHAYFVDGQLTVADAQGDFDSDPLTADTWETILVGTLGAGGKGLFALNVTDPAATDNAAAQAKFLWEITASSTGFEDLGYSYSTPVIARLSTGDWGVIVGNGYKNAGDGRAHLYVINIADGSLIRDIPLGASTSNGLSSPAAIDMDGDTKVDTVYVGDLDGNLWKVDISDGGDTSQWNIESGLNGKPLLALRDSTTLVQPVLSAPNVARHPDGGVMVYVGTGDELASSGTLTNAVHHSIYGVRDDNLSDTVTRTDLVQQSLPPISGHADYRTASNNNVDYSSKKGWYIDFASNEHLLQPPLVRDFRLQFMVNDRTADNEKNWLTQVDYITGGLPSGTVFDLNNDGALDELDNPDHNAETGTKGTRVVAINKTADLASRAIVVRSEARDHSLINTWTEQALNTEPGPVTCSMLWVDIRYVLPLDNDDGSTANGKHSIYFKGILDNGAIVDLKLSDLKFKKDAVYNKSDCVNDALCVHGNGGITGGEKIDLNFNRPDSDQATLSSPTGNGADASLGALGLRWDPTHIDLHRSNESFAIGIQFHSNLRLDHYTMEFDWAGVTDPDGTGLSQAVTRIEVGTGACGADFTVGSGRVLKDGATEDTLGGIASWDTPNQSFQINNPGGNELVFNASGDSAAELEKAGVVVDGTTDQTSQDANDNLVGRLRWRELIFGE